MEKKVAASDLKVGVYVTQLDRPWIDTPFLFQGFKVRTQEDLKLLNEYCSFVYIDPQKGEDIPTDLEPASDDGGRMEKLLASEPHPRYKDAVSADQEMVVAKQIHQRATEEVVSLLNDVEQGKEINVPGAKQVVGEIVESIIRNPDAFSWLTRLKTKDSYTYKHCLDVCALTITFGRYIGLPKEDLERLGLAALFFDIGKLKLPLDLLNKADSLTPQEAAVMKTHVRHSAQVLSKTSGVPEDVLEAVRCHHERHDGSGYPRRLSGDEIPIFARMIAITDVYDALISERPYGEQVSQVQAIGMLYQWRDTLFQEALVEQFIQCIGAYPVGSLVEITTGEIGVVLSHNRALRLQPKVLLVLDRSKGRYDFSPILDLTQDTQDLQGQPIAIKTVLDPGAYGIDLTEFYL